MSKLVHNYLLFCDYLTADCNLYPIIHCNCIYIIIFLFIAFKIECSTERLEDYEEQH